METEIALDDAEISAAEAHEVASVVDLSQSDKLVARRPADEDDRAPPFDPAAVPAHAAHFVIRIVPGIANPFGKRSERRLPMFRGRRLTQRFVRAFLVIVHAERIEAAGGDT